MSSKKLNIQNQVKVPEYLECFEARPGHVIIQKDYSAVEPTVLAHLSGCPRYRELYGPGANPNHDVYLFVGCRFPQFAHFLEYYDPDNPTAEGTAECKKLFKKDRGTCKVFHLAAAYLAWINTLHQQMVNAEIDISRDEIEVMYNVYWSKDLFAEVKNYADRLDLEWQRRGGWIKNALGRPIPASEDKRRDLLNTMCQSSGHDLLQWDNYYVDQLRRERKVPMYPLISDYHDEMLWEAPIECAKEAYQIMSDTQGILNDMLGWEIKIRGEPEFHFNVAGVKVDGYEYPEEQQLILKKLYEDANA